jgi:purine nucleosidase
MERVILDTDIGTNVDDALALTLALLVDQVKIDGITTVYGDVLLRAAIAQKYLNLAGPRGEAVQVFPGCDSPLLGLEVEDPFLGHEGKGIMTDAEMKERPWEDSASLLHGADFIVEMVEANPDEINLVAIGPLTNIALAFIKKPSIAKKIKNLFIMGGCISPGRVVNGRFLSYMEYNVSRDPEAARIVFSSGAPILLVPTDITSQVLFSREDIDALGEVRNPLIEGLTRQLHVWLDIRRMDRVFLHDPLTLALLIDPGFVKIEKKGIRVELSGTYTRGTTLIEPPFFSCGSIIDVAVDVDSTRFQSFLLQQYLEG